ncbi:MAG: hypothetical protein EOR45_06550 [Mesorhizobium sp.]|nr:MAG: hypothetical protein EOR45_06550 [Mesorhizobium sp.]
MQKTWHLPHKGGDWLSYLLPLITNIAGLAARAKLPISPQVGEMSGRTEGGAKDRYSFHSAPLHRPTELAIRQSLPPTCRNGDR